MHPRNAAAAPGALVEAPLPPDGAELFAFLLKRVQAKYPGPQSIRSRPWLMSCGIACMLSGGPEMASAWNVHGQMTFVGQGDPGFHSPYAGAQSLSGQRQFKNTASATAFLGVRPWRGGELYINPELMRASV